MKVALTECVSFPFSVTGFALQEQLEEGRCILVYGFRDFSSWFLGPIARESIIMGEGVGVMSHFTAARKREGPERERNKTIKL